MMEDAQPNETRLSRKGSAFVPRVRTTYPLHRDHRRPDRGVRSDHELVALRLPPECQKGAPGSQNARKRWIREQERDLQANRHLSVVSTKHLDHNSMLLNCRTRQTTQPTTRNARGNRWTGTHEVNGKDSIGVAPPLQSSEPGPSRVRPTPSVFVEPGSRAQRPDNPSLVTTSHHFVEPPRPSAFGTTSCPAQSVHRGRQFTTHTAPPPKIIIDFTPESHLTQNKPPAPTSTTHTAPAPEYIIDLTLDPDPVSETSFARWSTFRSGHVDIRLPPSSTGPKTSQAGKEPQLHANKTPMHIVEQPEGVSGGGTIWRSAQPSVPVHDACSTADHRIEGPISDQRCRRDGPQFGGSNAVVSEHEEVPCCTPLVGTLTSACGNLSLSLGSRDKPRRILRHGDFTYVVTAHGIIDQVAATSVLKWDRNIRSPSLPFEEFIDDACIMSHQGRPIIVLGHMREPNQITLLNLEHGQVPQHITLRREWNTARRPGVSAITPLMSPMKFASGGYDHRVHIWDIAHDLSGVSAVELAIKHASLVHSLLPAVDTSHKLVSVGADRDIHVYDMSAERVVHTFKTSCTPHHAHKADSLFSTLLEVAHLETQFEVRDRRAPYQSVQRFGFITKERRGRYEKADSWSHFVACGDKNGAVHLWDLRNVSTEVAVRRFFDDPVMQVVSAGSRLLACSKRNEVACINFQEE